MFTNTKKEVLAKCAFHWWKKLPLDRIAKNIQPQQKLCYSRRRVSEKVCPGQKRVTTTIDAAKNAALNRTGFFTIRYDVTDIDAKMVDQLLKRKLHPYLNISKQVWALKSLLTLSQQNFPRPGGECWLLLSGARFAIHDVFSQSGRNLWKPSQYFNPRNGSACFAAQQSNTRRCFWTWMESETGFRNETEVRFIFSDC